MTKRTAALSLITADMPFKSCKNVSWAWSSEYRSDNSWRRFMVMSTSADRYKPSCQCFARNIHLLWHKLLTTPGCPICVEVPIFWFQKCFCNVDFAYDMAINQWIIKWGPYLLITAKIRNRRQVFFPPYMCIFVFVLSRCMLPFDVWPSFPVTGYSRYMMLWQCINMKLQFS